jgi:small-conductance mechanosensitive channel/CRP-like cAMP-binding protein
MGSATPWLALPLAVAGVLALARLARVRPRYRRLVGPFALTAVVVAALDTLGPARLPETAWLAIAYLVPLLVLLVRATVLAFEALFERAQGEKAPALLESVVSVLLYGLGGGVIAHRWFGVELTPFLATSAVVGAVVGLALQDTLGNLFSGIALHIEAPFRVGDWVRVGDREGRVEQMSWRAMRLRTWDDDSLVIPNNEVARHAILNHTAPAAPHSRIVCLGVSYQTPPNKVMSVLTRLLQQVEGVLREPEPRLRVLAYGDHAIQYEVRYFFRDYGEHKRIEGEIHRLVWYHFRRHGIEIPFPIREVHLHTAPGHAAAGDAAADRLARALHGVDLFRPLSEEELRAATVRFRQLHYAAGERIIEEGDPGDSFFVIDRGEVEVSKELAGTRRPLARLMEGQFFGEMALLTGEPRAASVVAATDVDLFTIDKVGFHGVLVANPAMAVDISTILAERREALSQVEGDLTARYESAPTTGELKQRILDRIRSYFGL